MKILFLAPHPVFQERGSPIADKLALTVLSTRQNTRVDLLSYAEGSDLTLPNVVHHRAHTPKYLQGVRPGASLLKFVHDIVFFFTALRLVWRNRSAQYDLVHCVEEAAFMGLFIKWCFGIPYVYDMDSSMAMQLVERWPVLRIAAPLFSYFERLVIRNALVVIPVCDALAEIVVAAGPAKPEVLSDISLLDTSEGKMAAVKESDSLRLEFGITEKDLMVLYVGNLEPYQGIDLLMESFVRVAPKHPNSRLVIVGGRSDHVAHYRAWVSSRNLDSRVHLTGARPLPLLDAFLSESDILVSPRTLGNNTPMKIYSYLHSGKALVATRLFTHTQVMDDSVAELAAPTADAFAEGLLRVLTNDAHRLALGQRAKELAERKYTFRAFSEVLNRIYDRIESRIVDKEVSTLHPVLSRRL